jgi:hypothetical protein
MSTPRGRVAVVIVLFSLSSALAQASPQFGGTMPVQGAQGSRITPFVVFGTGLLDERLQVTFLTPEGAPDPAFRTSNVIIEPSGDAVRMLLEIDASASLGDRTVVVSTSDGEAEAGHFSVIPFNPAPVQASRVVANALIETGRTLAGLDPDQDLPSRLREAAFQLDTLSQALIDLELDEDSMPTRANLAMIAEAFRNLIMEEGLQRRANLAYLRSGLGGLTHLMEVELDFVQQSFDVPEAVIPYSDAVHHLRRATQVANQGLANEGVGEEDLTILFLEIGRHFGMAGASLGSGFMVIDGGFGFAWSDACVCGSTRTTTTRFPDGSTIETNWSCTRKCGWFCCPCEWGRTF